jgi:hypothetical protein
MAVGDTARVQVWVIMDVTVVVGSECKGAGGVRSGMISHMRLPQAETARVGSLVISARRCRCSCQPPSTTQHHQPHHHFTLIFTIKLRHSGRYNYTTRDWTYV